MISGVKLPFEVPGEFHSTFNKCQLPRYVWNISNAKLTCRSHENYASWQTLNIVRYFCDVITAANLQDVKRHGQLIFGEVSSL